MEVEGRREGEEVEGRGRGGEGGKGVVEGRGRGGGGGIHTYVHDSVYVHTCVSTYPGP